MYPFERYMKVFKGWVKSRKHPDGCIAECYIVEEAVEFCAERMLDNHITVGIPQSCRSYIHHATKRKLGTSYLSVYGKAFDQVHLSVLHNTEDARPYFAEHLETLRLENASRPPKTKKWQKDRQNKTFATWLKKRGIK